MEKRNKTVEYRGLGFLPTLTLIFIVLKLCGVINWSWFWVLSPTIIPIIFLLPIIFIVILLSALLDD